MNFILGITAAAGLVFGGFHFGGSTPPQPPPGYGPGGYITPVVTMIPAATPTPVPGSGLVPAECSHITFDNVIDEPGFIGFKRGTEGNDLIIIKQGSVLAGGGDDCVVFIENGTAYGGAGNDVLIRLNPALGGIASGDSGTDRCVGNWHIEMSCELE